MATASRPPPSLVDPGAEAALLGTFMRDPRRLDDRRVHRSLFASPPHVLVFDALRAAHDQGTLAGDLLTASAALEANAQIPMPRSFTADAFDAADLVLPDALLTHVWKLARRRQLRALSLGLAAVAEHPHPDDDPETLATIAARTADLAQNGHGSDPTIPLASVDPERVEWLWTYRIPFGKLTILDGDPGLGKTALTLDLAARVSRGLPLPDDPEPPWPAAHVLLVNAEDGAADTLRPRLDAAGADCTRCHAFPLDQVPILPDDLPRLHLAIDLHRPALVIIDPLMAVLAPTIDAYKDQSVRAVLRLLAALAESTHAAILVVRHLTKQAGPKALYRGGGSIAFSAAARSSLLLGADSDADSPDELRALAVVKHNLAPKASTLRLRLVPHADSLRLEYVGTSSLSADDLVAPPSPPDAAEPVKFAMDFLADLLAHGPVESDSALRSARAQGISNYAWNTAKHRLHVRSTKATFSGGWHLSLPPSR
jgi:hypothetical protein